jgi:prepilin peptidase dependent protein B
MARNYFATATSQRGLSIVELLVGVALGLVVAAAAAKLLAGQLGESRSLLREARLMQDLRTAADLVTRDLRRVGHWGAAASGVWGPGASASAVLPNPYAALPPGDAASDAISFQFSRDGVENHSVDSNERFGFRLRNGTLEMQLGAANWQALTDTTLLTVTVFSITPTVQTISLAGYCAAACTGGSCPQQQVRSLAVRLAGRARSDATVTRSVHSEVRLRNDAFSGACPA